MIVRELITRLGFNMDPAQANKVENRIRGMKTQAEAAAQSVRNLVAAYASFVSVGALVRVADEMQSIRARIGMLPQTIMDAGDAFDVVAARANNAKQGVEEYAGFYIKAANATQDFIKNQEDVLKVVDGVAFGLAASGASAVAQSQAFFQLGQAIGSPVVQMEEMNTLIDVAPDLFRELGRVIPGANGNLKKFIGTGAVTGKMLAEGLVKAADTFETKMRKMPMNIGVATVLIGNRFKLMIDRMNRDSMIVTTVANLILNVFDRIEAGIESVVDKFDGWGNILRFIGAAIVVALGSKALAVLSAFRLAALVAFLPFLKMIAIGTLLTLVLEDLYIWFKGGESAIGGFVKWLMEANGSASLLRNGLLLLGIAFASWAAGAIASTIAAKVAIIKSITLMAASFLAAGLKIAIAWAVAFWPVALAIAAIAAVGFAAYKLVENWETVKAWFTEFFDWILGKFGAVGKYAGNLLGKAARFIGISTDEEQTSQATPQKTAKETFAKKPTGLTVNDVASPVNRVVIDKVDSAFKPFTQKKEGSELEKSQRFLNQKGLNEKTRSVSLVSDQKKNTETSKIPSAFKKNNSELKQAPQKISEVFNQFDNKKVFQSFTQEQVMQSFTPSASVAPAQVAPRMMGAVAPNVSNTTQVNVTVPPGTTAEQVQFIETAAQKSFSKVSNDKLARDMSVYAP